MFIFVSPLSVCVVEERTDATQNRLCWPTPMGALTQLYAGTTPEGLKFNGKVKHNHVPDL
jgi:hypothetical protein